MKKCTISTIVDLGGKSRKLMILLQTDKKQRRKVMEQDFDCTVKLTETLPIEWLWVRYDDGSGYLRNANGQRFFMYDLTTNYMLSGGIEYKETQSSNSYDIFYVSDEAQTSGDANKYLNEFKQYAEKFVIENYI